MFLPLNYRKRVNKGWQKKKKKNTEEILINYKRVKVLANMQGHTVADTLLLMMFLGLRKLGNICCVRNKCCVAHAGKRGNISVGNNVSATMCSRLPVP